MGVYIPKFVELFDTQGPAPDGFHVPLTTEWQSVSNIWNALGGSIYDGANFGIALKLPFAGARKDDDTSVVSVGSSGIYWSSSRYNAYQGYGINISNDIRPQFSNGCSYGFSVRCFKDVPVVPTSSWTKLYGTSIEAGGIFWSSADGLISLSSDGQTWITIADKNLGATTVWNSGDALTDANCGYFYQRGNNYGFPHSGTVTTSSTKVDASNYGPGDYYSSSTFITGYYWDSSNNTNLRGGVSQGTYTKVIHQKLKNAYIGEYEYTLYEGANGKIIHKYALGEIWLVPTLGTTIKIQDKDVGATVAGTTSASYGEWYVFASLPTAPSGYHIPIKSEWESLMNLWQQITGSNSDDLIIQHLLIPGVGFRNTSRVQQDIGAGLYWSSTSNTSSAAWGTRFYPTATYMDMFSHGKSYGLCVRCFKD